MYAAAAMVYVPRSLPTVTVVGSTTSAAIALPTGAVRVMFTGTEGFTLTWGSSSVSAAVAATGYPYQPDTDYVFDVPPGITHYTAIRTGSSDSSLALVAVG